MASIQFIQSRIANKQKKITSLAKQITALQEEISQDQIQLAAQLDNMRTIQSNLSSLVDFIYKWRLTSFEYYNSRLQSYYRDVQHIHDLTDKLRELKYCDVHHYDYLEVCKLEKELDDARAAFDAARTATDKYYYLSEFTYTSSTYEEAVSSLTKWLDRTTNKLYDNAVKRIQDKVGDILDASSLKLREGGWIHGKVVGVNGTVVVRGYGMDWGYCAPKVWSKTLKERNCDCKHNDEV